MYCTFETDFRPRYEKTGKKNLRCFPNCSEVGHITTGFCGRAISVCISINNQQVKQLSTRGTTDLDQLQIWGHITKSKNQPPSPKKRLPLPTQQQDPTHYPLAFFENKERTKQTPTKEYLPGQVVSISKNATEVNLMVTFNDKKLSWHYGWQSSKNTCDINHCFKVILVTLDETSALSGLPNGEATHLKFVQAFFSSDFKLYSRHRVRKLRQLVQSGAFAETMIPAYDKNFLYKVKNPGERNQLLNNVPNSPVIDNVQGFLPGSLQQKKRTKYSAQNTGINGFRMPSLQGFDSGISNSSSMLQNTNTLLDPMNVSNPYGNFMSPGGEQINLLLSQIKAGYNLELLAQPQGRSYLGVPQSNPTPNLLRSQTSSLPGVVSRVNDDCFLDASIEEKTIFARFLLFLMCFCQGETEVPQDIADQSGIPGLAKTCINGVLTRCILPDNHLLTYSNENVLCDMPENSIIAYKALYALVLQKGTHKLKKDIVELVNNLEQVSLVVIGETELTSRISGLLSTWKSDPNQLQLSETSRTKLEGNINPSDIDILMHLDTLKFNPKYNRLLTLEQEIVQLSFSFLKNILHSQGTKISDYTELMSIAAEYLLPIDSAHNPTTSVRKYINDILASPNADVVSIQWETMLGKLRSHYMRQAIVHRIKQERELSLFQLKAQVNSPINEQLVYMQGLWEFEQFRSTSQIEGNNFERTMFNIAGLSNESFFTKLLIKMFSKWQINNVTQEAFFLQAQKKLLSNPCYKFNLSGQLKDFVLPLPIPFPVRNLNTKVRAWVHVSSSEELPSIRLLFCGDVFDRKRALSNFLSSEKSLIPKNRFVLAVTVGLSSDFATLKVNVLGEISYEPSFTDISSSSYKKMFESLESTGKHFCEISYKRGF